VKITDVVSHDIRFPTARERDGSDSMNQGDYSAAYVVLRTDQPGLEGHGLTFTNGRGNELCVAAVHALEGHVRGRSLDGIKTGNAKAHIQLLTPNMARSRSADWPKSDAPLD